jgi:hypothetical protein
MEYTIDVCKSVWSMTQYNYEVSLLIFFGLDDLSIDKSGVLMPSSITVSGPICHFTFNNICFMKLGALVFFADVLQLLYIIEGLFPLLICSGIGIIYSL